MTTLDQRLHDHHDRLVADFADALPRPLAQPHAALRRRRLLPLLAGAAAVVAAAGVLTVRLLPSAPGSVTLQVPPYTVVAEAATTTTPHLTPAQAEAAGLRALQQGNQRGDDPLHITGYTVTTRTFAPGVRSVQQACGAHISIPTAHNLWVVAMIAPPQNGLTFIRAAVLVDDATGQLLGGQILTSRVTPTGSLAACHWGS